MDKIKLKVLIKRAILDGIKYHYEMAELGRGSNFDQFAEDRVKDFEKACDGDTSETGERQLHKQNVSQQRELLVAFMKMREGHAVDSQDIWLINEFLSNK